MSATEDGPLDVSDPGRIRRARDCFDRAGYTRKRVLEVLDAPDTPTTRLGRRELPRLLRRSSGVTPFDTLFRLFTLGETIDADTLAKAIAPNRPEEWVAMRLLAPEGDGFRSTRRVAPSENLLLVLEAQWTRAPVDGTQVMAVSGSSMALAQMTVRWPVESALDLGTGCGVQALLAAPHSKHIVGTDNNPRALNLADFNAHFNHVAGASFLQGDLFGPVEGRQFDLIVSNPPYVISPERQALYRDSGLPGDAVCERIIRALPGYLKPGGFGQVMINWVQKAGEDWRDRLRGWVRAGDCDVWLFRHGTVEPEKYATTWLGGNPDADPETYNRRFDAWMAYYESEKIEAIGEGLITLRRRPGATNWFAYDETPEQVGPCGDSVMLGFALRDFLASAPDDGTLLAKRFRMNPAARWERYFQPTDRAWGGAGSKLKLTRGLCFGLQLDGGAAAVVERLRPDRPLGAALEELAAAVKEPAGQITPKAMPLVRCLIEEGFLLPDGIG